MARINAPQFGKKRRSKSVAYTRQHYNLAVSGKATQNCGNKSSSSKASAPKPAPPKGGTKRK